MKNKNVIRTILINIFIFLFLLIILNILSYFILAADAKHDTFNISQAELFGMSPENYQDYESDKQQIQMQYSSFNGWSCLPLYGKVLSVNEEGNRTTINTKGVDTTDVFFFGGSAMWGYGNIDLTTIPSLFAKQFPDSECTNYSEFAFSSKQSMVSLLKLLSVGKKPSLVISMDGVNDMYQYCSNNTDIKGHYRENGYNQSLHNYEKNPLGSFSKNFKIIIFQIFIQNTFEILEKIRFKIFGFDNSISKVLSCDAQPEKYEVIANQLIENWTLMHNVCNAKGIDFIAIVQPNLVSSKVTESHSNIKLNPDLVEHYSSFYKVLKEKLKESDRDWIYDFTAIFDKYQNETVFIDDCHLKPKGNSILVDELLKRIKVKNILH